MDSKEYAAAMAVIELLKGDQQLEAASAAREFQASQEAFRYKRNKKDQEERYKVVDEKSTDNTQFQSLTQRVGQVNKDWSVEEINTLKEDLNKGLADVRSDADWYDEYEVMYNSLHHTLDNRIKHNQKIWNANNKYNDFELKILNLHNAKSPQALTAEVKSILEMEKNIIKNFRDDMEANQRSQFNKYVTRDLPIVKSMVNVFDNMDSDKSDEVFTPDIKDFSAYAFTTTDPTGAPLTINKSADQARLEMVTAYNYFKNGNFKEAQKLFNRAIQGYKPNKVSTISSGTTPSGVKDNLVSVVPVGGAYHIRGIWDPKLNNNVGAYNEYGRLGTTLYGSNQSQDVTYKALEERWTKRLSEWNKDKISVDPYNILTQKVVTAFFGATPQYKNVSEVRAFLNTDPGRQIMDQMTGAAGVGGEKGLAMMSEVLYMLENPTLLASAEANVLNFGGEMAERRIAVDLMHNKENFDVLEINRRELYNLWNEYNKGSSNVRFGASMGAWDWGEVYEAVYKADDAGSAPKGQLGYKFGKTEPSTGNFRRDEMFKAKKFINLGLSAYAGTQSSGSVNDADYTYLSSEARDVNTETHNNISTFSLLTRFESSWTMAEDIMSEISNHSGDYDNEAAGNLLGFNNVAYNFQAHFINHYYGNTKAITAMKDRIRGRLLDGIPVGDGITLVQTETRGKNAQKSRYFQGTQLKLITQEDMNRLAPGAGIEVISPGTIKTPYGILKNHTLLDVESTIETAKIMGISPAMKSNASAYFLYGRFDKKSLSYQQLYGEPFPLYSTGKR